MKKRQIFSLLAATSTALALTACGNAPSSSDNASSDSTSSANSDFTACLVSDNGGFQDKSFNQSAHEGVERAASELGIQTKFAQSKQESDFTTNVNSMVTQNCSLIIGVGYLLNDAIVDAAEKNPDINFALIDSGLTKGTEPANLSNAKPLLFDTSQSAFLAGYVAASQTKSGKVGGYVGMSLPTTENFVDGFKLGIQQYNTDNSTNVEFLGDGQVVGDFSNQTKGKQITDNLISQGVDIVMPVAGPVGLGTLSSAKENGNTKVVWVDSDGYQSTDFGDIILTSVKKEIGNAVYDTIKTAVSGSFNPEAYVGTLENGGVSIAPFYDFDDDVSDEVKTRLDELKEAIIAGKQVYASEDWIGKS